MGEGGSTERLAEVETDEVFVTKSNVSLSLRRGGRARGRRGVSDIKKLFHSASPFHTLLIRQPALRKLRLSATFSHKRRLTQAALLGNRRMYGGDRYDIGPPGTVQCSMIVYR